MTDKTYYLLCSIPGGEKETFKGNSPEEVIFKANSKPYPTQPLATWSTAND